MYKKSKRFVSLGVLYLEFLRDVVFLIVFTIYAYPLAILKKFLPKGHKSLKHEVILVTGAANGVGRELCLRVGKIEKCCTIICWDINEPRMASLVGELNSLGVKKVGGFQVDICDHTQVKKAAQRVRQEFGDVTVLFNNVGQSMEPKPFWKQSSEDIEKVLKSNLVSNLWVLKEFLPSMILKDHGHIVTVSSILGLIHTKHASTYSAAKHGVHGCVESIRQDLQNLPEPTNVHLMVAYTSANASPIMQNLRATMKYPFLLPRLSADKVAEQILNGMRAKRDFVYIPGYSWLAVVFKNFALPSVYQKSLELLHDAMASCSEDMPSQLPI